MRRLLVVLALLALARPAAAHILDPTLTPLALTRLALAATPPPASANLVRVVNYTMANGQTLTLRMFAGDSPEQRRKIASLADRIEAAQRAEQLKDGYIDGDPDWSAYSDGEFGGQDVQFRVEEGVALACAVIGAAAQKYGYVNIWLDAVNALCLSFVIVDLGERLGEALAPAYLALMRSRRPKVNPIIMGLYSYGGLPIF